MATIRKSARTGDEPLDTGPGMPRWVKIFLITTVALLVVLVLALALSGGQHGPGRHLSSPPPVSATAPDLASERAKELVMQPPTGLDR